MTPTITELVTIVVVAKEGGLMKLETTPGGGGYDGIFDRSISGGICEKSMMVESYPKTHRRGEYWEE